MNMLIMVLELKTRKYVFLKSDWLPQMIEMLFFRKQYRKYKICWNVFVKLDLKLKNYNGCEVVMIYRNPCSNQSKVIASKNNQPEQGR